MPKYQISPFSKQMERVPIGEVASGSTFPSAPLLYDFFVLSVTGRKVLMQWSGTSWIPRDALSTITVYVDASNGTDDQELGYGTGTSAFATYAFAKAQIPNDLAYNATIILSAEDYTENIEIGGIQVAEDVEITIQGTLPTADDTGTAESAADYTMLSAGLGARLPYLTDTDKSWGTGGVLESGTTDSIGTDTYILRETGQNFSSTVKPGMQVHNTDDDTWTQVVALDISNGDEILYLKDDIMDDGEAYEISYGEHRHKLLILTGGTGSGQEAFIDSNTDDILYIAGKWSTTPDNTTTYSIYDPESMTTIDLSGSNDTSIIGINVQNQKGLQLKYLNLEEWPGYYGIDLFESSCKLNSIRLYRSRTDLLGTTTYGIYIENKTLLKDFRSILIESPVVNSIDRGIRAINCSSISPSLSIDSGNIKIDGCRYGAELLTTTRLVDFWDGCVIRNQTINGLIGTSFTRTKVRNLVITGCTQYGCVFYQSQPTIRTHDISGCGNSGILLQYDAFLINQTATSQINYCDGYGINVIYPSSTDGVSISYTGNSDGEINYQYDEILTADLINESGTSTVEGYVYRIDPDNNESFDYGTEDEDAVVCVSKGVISNNISASMVICGTIDIYVDATTSRNDYLYFGSTSGQAKPSSTRNSGAFAQAIEARTGAGLVKAILLNVGSDVVVKPDLASITNPTAGSTLVGVQGIGSPTIDTLHKDLGTIESAGLVSAADITAIITDGGSETVDTTALVGKLRATDSYTGELYQFDLSATTGNSIPTDTVRWIGVEWNSGTPQIVVKTSDSWDRHTDFPLGTVVNENGTLHILNNPLLVVDAVSDLIHRFYDTEPLKRADRIGGLILGETGTRNVTVTAGELYDRSAEFSISAIDTSGADTFDSYSSAGLESSGNTQWDNANYDNAGTLTALTALKYANLWWWVEADGSLVCVYGTDQYATAALAAEEGIPATIPDRLTYHGKFIGRFIIQQGASSADTIQSAFTTTLGAAAVTSHDDLSGVTENNHHNRSHTMTSTSDHTAGNDKVFYSDGSGNVQEVTLGTSGSFLLSQGTGSAPIFDHEELQDGSLADSLHLHNYTTCTLTNKSGATTTVGYVYRHDPDNDRSFDYASEDEDANVLVAQKAITNNSQDEIVDGGCIQVYVDGVTDADISVGIKYLYFSSTQGQAKIAADRRDGCFGEVVEDSSGAGLVHAKIYQVPPRKWSWLDEQTWDKHIIIPVHATAGADGITKTSSSTGPIVDLGGAGEFDENGVLHPGVIAIYDEQQIYIYYTGQDDTYAVGDYRRFKIGVATVPLLSPESTGTKSGSNPILSAANGTWEDQAGSGVMNPAPLYNVDAQNAYDTGTATAADATGLTMTDSGATWTTNQWAGKYVANLSDTGGANAIGGVGRVVSNTGTVLTISGGMSGGAANDWQIGDSYFIIDTNFFLFYVGAGGDAAQSSIGMAVSTDGTTMVKVGQVLVHGAGNTFHTYPSASAIRLGRIIYLFYKDTTGAISGFYSETDGLSWTDIGTVLTLGTAGAWDDQALFDLKITHNQGNLYATYSGRDTTGGAAIYQIGMAITTLKDFLTGTYTLTRYDKNPIVYINNPGTGTYDDGAHFGPDHIFLNNTMYMWYGALDSGSTERRIFLCYIKRSI